MPGLAAALPELAVSAELGFVASPCVAPTLCPPNRPEPPIPSCQIERREMRKFVVPELAGVLILEAPPAVAEMMGLA